MDDAFFERHRAQLAARQAYLASIPDMSRFRQAEPAPPSQEPSQQFQNLIDGKPRFERTEEQERIRARGMAMLQIEEALAAEEAAAKAQATADFKRTAMGRLLR